MLKTWRKLQRRLNDGRQRQRQSDELKLMLGSILAKQVAAAGVLENIADMEFQVFSQCGDDGIIQYLINHVDIENKTFIEFGVENYRESNTRFLLQNNSWSGFVMDGDEANIRQIKNSWYYWRHDLQAVACFVDTENINDVISGSGFGADVGLMHIDIDGNDYWVWKAIECVQPLIVIIEYNSVFGSNRAITVPYEKDFQREKAHFSYLYFGASLEALIHLGKEKNYVFAGCNSFGNNAYFIRADKVTDALRLLTENACFVASGFRESRDNSGALNYLRGPQRLSAIKGLPVVDVHSGRTVEL